MIQSRRVGRICRKPPRSQRIRAGITLLQAVGMMVTTGALMSLSATVLSRAFQAHTQAIEHMQVIQRLQQLRERLVRDVRSANRAHLEEGFIELSSQAGDRADRNVRYEADGNLIRRIQAENGGSEEWTLPSPCRAVWSHEDTGRGGLVHLSLRFDDSDPLVAPISWSIRLQNGPQVKSHADKGEAAGEGKQVEEKPEPRSGAS